jgi:AcrR family transcriptional regulator
LLPADALSKAELRREMILAAARQIFMRKGFELATMQDVATACDMSPGNLYRYFPSKAAIIEGLVEHDRKAVAAKFEILANVEDMVSGFEQLARTYFKEEAAKDAGLTLQIWAAASRTPELRDICSNNECTIQGHLMAFFSTAQERGRIASEVNPELLCSLVMSLSEGLIHKAALMPEFDIDRELDIMFATLNAAFAGHISLKPTHLQKRFQ